MSLRLKLVLLVVLPLTVIFTALVLLQFASMREAAMSRATEHALLLTQATAREIDGALAKAVHVTHAGAVALKAAPEWRGERVWPMLEELVRRVPLVDGASIAFAPNQNQTGPVAPYVWQKDGLMQRRDLKESYDYTKRPWYTIASDGTAGWTRPYDGPVTAFLVGPDDRFISHPDEMKIMQPSNSDGGPALLAEAAPGTLQRFSDWPNDAPHIVAFEPIQTADWIFAAAMSEDEVLGPVHRQLAWNVALLILAGVVISGLVLGMGLRITGDVRKLAAAVARVSAGDLEARVDRMRRRDELGDLVQDFNAMTLRLRDTVQHVADEQVARRAIEQELDVAREIQEEMLPHEYPMMPDHPEVDLHAIIVAARHVAGDFYDYWVRGDTLTIVLADVSGSGMPAALVMVRAMTLLRQFDDPDRTLSSVVARTNESLCSNNDRQLFVTGVIIRLDLRSGAYHLVSAGHLPALLGDGGGTVWEEGDSTGPLLGVIHGGQWEERVGLLPPGGWIGLYTDGITEARNPDGEMFEGNRLAAGLAELPGGSSEVLCGQGVRRAEGWHGGRVDDDLSMMVLRWVGPPS